MSKVHEGLAGNFDEDDSEYISLREELECIFKKKTSSKSGRKKCRQTSPHSKPSMPESKS